MYNLVSKNRVKYDTLAPADDVELYAANGTRVAVVGRVRFEFRLLRSPTFSRLIS